MLFYTNIICLYVNLHSVKFKFWLLTQSLLPSEKTMCFATAFAISSWLALRELPTSTAIITFFLRWYAADSSTSLAHSRHTRHISISTDNYCGYMIIRKEQRASSKLSQQCIITALSVISASEVTTVWCHLLLLSHRQGFDTVGWDRGMASGLERKSCLSNH